jgi:hypothetical protein
MKGPSGRLQNRVPRCWICPRCGRTAETSGAVVMLACKSCPPDAADNPVLMAVVDPVKVRRPTAASPPNPAPIIDSASVPDAGA